MSKCLAQCVCVCVSCSVLPDSVTSWTTAFQAPLSMGFSRQEYRSGLPFPSPGDLPDPGIEPGSPALHADSLPSEPPGKPKNIGVGSLSLLQVIFLTQEFNQGFLHCRWIILPAELQGKSHSLGSQHPGIPGKRL